MSQKLERWAGHELTGETRRLLDGPLLWRCRLCYVWIELAARLGIEAGRLWPKLIWVYWTRGLLDLLLWPLVLSVLVVWGWRLYRRGLAIHDHECRGDHAYGDDFFIPFWIGAFVIGALVLVLLIIYAVNLPGLFVRLFDPEGSFVLDHLPQR